jgi:hypothetical protein
VAEFEKELKAERTRLRALTSEKSKAEREKDSVLAQLQRNESVSAIRDFPSLKPLPTLDIGHGGHQATAPRHQAGKSRPREGAPWFANSTFYFDQIG